MINGKKILAIIPARKNSKRVPNKNIRQLAGKPLIYHTIKTALDCSDFVDDIIVTTDSKKIAKIAERFGANIPFIRPKELARDNVSDKPVIKHCIDFLRNKGNNYDYILYLKPTAPLRLRSDLYNAINVLYKNKIPLVRSVTRATGVHHPYWMYKNKGDLLYPLIEKVNIENYFQSQLLPKNIFYLNGMIEAFTLEHILSSGFIYNSNKMGFIEIPKERSIDIDEQIDFDIANLLIKKYLKTDNDRD